MRKYILSSIFMLFSLTAIAQMSISWEGLFLEYPNNFEMEKQFGNGMYQVFLQDEDGRTLQLFYNHDAKILAMPNTDIENMCVFWTEWARTQLGTAFTISTNGLESQYSISALPYTNRCMNFTGKIESLFLKGKIYTIFVEDYMFLAYYWCFTEDSPQPIMNILKSVKIKGHALTNIK